MEAWEIVVIAAAFGVVGADNLTWLRSARAGGEGSAEQGLSAVLLPMRIAEQGRTAHSPWNMAKIPLSTEASRWPGVWIC